MFLWLILGLAAAVAAGGGAKGRSLLKGRATKKPGLVGKRVGETGDATYVGPAVTIDQANGYEPIFIQWAHGHTLEWGACYKDWADELGKGMGETAAQNAMIGFVQSVSGWVLDEVPIISWIIDRICFRVNIPCMQLRILNGPELWGPSEPRGVPRTGYDPHGAFVIQGWNPESTRVGFPAKFTSWPREWPPPKDAIAAGWLKNWGDKYGVGHDVYQLITAQHGEEKSFILMTRSGWRAIFRKRAASVNFPADVASYNRGHNDAIAMFQYWKGAGQSSVDKGSATRKKAMNRFT